MFEGLLLTPDGELLKGRLIYERNMVKFEEGADSREEFLFTPGLCNSHIHIGDSVFKDPPYLPLKDLVAPPDGLKHQILEKTDKKKKIAAISQSIKLMRSYGISVAVDFREEGIQGVEILQNAIKSTESPVEFMILSRPSELSEGEKLLEISDGFGFSSVRDQNFKFIEELRSLCSKKDKIFSIHAGEQDNKDVDLALTLSPDLLVHMVKSDPQQLKMAMDDEIPICVCPRSNIFSGNIPEKEIIEMLSSYEKLLLGTDNVMMNSPDIFREMEMASKLFFKNDLVVLKSVFNFYRIFEKSIKEYLIFDLRSPNLSNASSIVSSFVRRCSPEDLIGVMGEKGWTFRRKVFKE